MAYVITAVGAGGKTSYLRRRAQEFLRQGKKTALTTTTHIWPPSLAEGGIQDGRGPGRSLPGQEDPWAADAADRFGMPDCFGTPDAAGKLTAPDHKTYERICREYDVVLVEGDGSHAMPVKIPAAYEPVIPENTDEIVVVMGAHAIGRRIDAVCQRYDQVVGFEPTAPSGAEERAGFTHRPNDGRYARVTRKMLEEIARRYYLEPLRERYPEAKISYVLSRMPRTDLKIAGVMMASGFGRRYGGNKLLEPFRGKPLYRHCLDHVTDALGRENVAAVTQYDKIMDQVRALGIEAVRNDQAEEGIAASIRLGTRWALEKGADAVMFFAADMPSLPPEEIALFAAQFAGSGKKFGCMEFGKDHISTNPGAFRLKDSAKELLQLTGDRGAMRIMKQEPWNIYYYQIPPEFAADVDVSPLPAERSQTSSHQTGLSS